MNSLLDGVRRQVKGSAHLVSDYDMLQKFVSAWADGTGHKFLIILGRPGCLKSSTVRATFQNENQRLWVEGDTGPLALYRDLFLEVNKPTVMDDVKITGSRTRVIVQRL